MRVPHRFLMRLCGSIGLVWLLALAACAPRQETVSFWAMGREGEVVTELLPEFERTHPGVKVVVQQLPWTAAHEKLLTAFAGDATPDVAQLGNTWIPEMSALGALEPLGPRIAASSVVTQSDYFPGIWDTNVIAGVVYGVPWYVDTRLLFYRKDLLAQAGFNAPPKTWDEWRKMMAAIKTMVGAERYAVLLPVNEFEPLWCWVCSRARRCCAKVDAGATSAATMFARHWVFTARCSSAAGHRP